MRQFPAVAALVTFLGIFVLGACAEAQYYPYRPPQRSYGQTAPQAPHAHMSMRGLHYYARPDVQRILRWRQYQRQLDYERVLRSPQNPESALDYMLRTW